MLRDVIEARDTHRATSSATYRIPHDMPRLSFSVSIPRRSMVAALVVRYALVVL